MPEAKKGQNMADVIGVGKERFCFEIEMPVKFDDMGPMQRRLHNAAVVLDAEQVGHGFAGLLREAIGEIARLTTERDNAEKREYEVLGRANALETELKATQARLDASDELLRDEFAQRQDAITYLTPAQRQEYQAHLNAGMRKMLDTMTPNVDVTGAKRPRGQQG